MRLHDFFDYCVRANPNFAFAAMGDQTVTYGEASKQVNRLANALASAGIKKGDRVAFLSKNSIEYALMYYADARSGVVPVPLNYRLVPKEWAFIINDSQAKMLLESPEYLEAVDGIRPELETTSQYVSVGGAASPGWTDLQEWVDAQPDSEPEVYISADDDLLQMYTSGTTGHPKGVVLTHRSVTANVIQTFPELTMPSGHRSLVAAPVYHLAAAFGAFSAVSQGGCLMIHEDFNPVEVVRALDEDKINWGVLVPARIQACLVAVPDVAQREYADLELLAYGGSPIAGETLAKSLEVFKCDFIQVYGMTELSPCITLLSAADHRRALNGKPELLLSGGRAVMGTDLRIVDEDDHPVPNGTMGEICGRGPQVMKGYWNLPEETAEAMRNGWMHTGDAGTLDDEGYLYVQDRVKDMIVSGGENVYPRVVEEVLFKHPAIADAAVIGVPDQRLGETVKAVVQLREGMSATEDELIEHCRGEIGGFQLPKTVDFIDTLPRNALGKVLKRELREPYWDGQARRVAGS